MDEKNKPRRLKRVDGKLPSTETRSTEPPPRPVRKKRRKPMAKSTLIFLVFWLTIIGLSFILVINQAGTYNELRADLERIEDDIAAITQENYNLSLQIQFFDSDAYIEQRAREWLGMVRPHEIVFRNIAE